jgi:hypothetical protein
MHLSRGVIKIRLTLLLTLAGAGALGCVPTANTNQLPSGAASLPCYGQTCVPDMVGAPVTDALEVDCDAAEAGLEFFPYFNVLDNQGGTSKYFYQYVDGTAGIWPSGYGPPAIQQQICKNGPAGNYVMHESGGLFTGWGGGIGVGLAHFNSADAELCVLGGPVCPAAGGYTTSTQCFCPPLNNPDLPVALSTAINLAAIDVSQWDGISFWARRGPNGQPLMRVLVGDRYTDDDISYLEYSTDPKQARLCERKIECTCPFQDTTCDWYSADPKVDPMYASIVTAGMNPPPPDVNVPPSIQNGGYFCGAPGTHPAPASSGGPGSNGNICGRTLCDNVYAAYPNNGPDPQSVGRACSPYTYRSGAQADICYNPGVDPLPAEADEQCGDHFTFPVHLSTEWQFYTVPFTQMFQQGWAKQAPYFDLTSVSVVRFTWDAGYVDYYIDNVRFYRIKANGSSTTPPP